MTPSGSKRMSLADVAKIAGVSISTVSKVANGATDVSDSTRERVSRIMEERGYVSKRRRQSLSTVITVMARDMYSPFTLAVIRGAVDSAASIGARIAVAPYPEGPSGGNRWLDELVTSGTGGLIAVTSTLDAAQREAIHERGIPLIAIDPVDPPDDRTYSVGSTNWAGAFNATEHVLSLGHRRIAMLGGLLETMAGRARVSGYHAALDAAGVPADSREVLARDFTFDAGVELGTELLSRSHRPTAVIAASDFQALGVIEAARQLGLRVPEDVSIVGFDDLIVSQMSSPPLTTVHQPVDVMGAVAVQNLSALISGEAITVPRHTELATRLVVRKSTKSLGEAASG